MSKKKNRSISLFGLKLTQYNKFERKLVGSAVNNLQQG